MKLGKGKVSISADISVYTRYPNGRKRHEKDGLEARIETFLSTCYKVYMKHLIAQLPNADKYELIDVDDHNMDLRRKHK
jgi:hypothetical protein